ncbi:MAG: hypothetical protein NZ898_11010 [Myxococcota bacterium]|nr:hypothetical protein [Myxococcota bacterium]MDW8362413.1 hypothetical protein [Myxococcales bacterium]
MPHPDFDYLVISDLHLGGDLVQHARPWTAPALERPAPIDAELGSMLEAYAGEADRRRPWTLVLAGDAFDLVGMSIAPAPDAPDWEALEPEEREHGLGSRPEHAATKVRAIASRHRPLFERLARLVDAGHRIVVVHGNHDVELFWSAARRALIDALAAPLGNGREHRARVAAAVRFEPWFARFEDVLWVEHGHLYDATCRQPWPLLPVDPHRPRRIRWSLSDLLLRRVVRPIPRLSASGHDERGMLDFLRLTWRMGPGRAASAAARLLGVVVEALRGAMRDASHRLAAAHERRMLRLAARHRIAPGVLRALGSLWAPPADRSPTSLLRHVLVDRVLLGAGAGVAGAAMATMLPAAVAAPAIGAVGAVAAASVLVSGRKFAEERDVPGRMRRAATRIAGLVRTPIVAMGHTHRPLADRVGEGVTLFNTGTWAHDPDEPDLEPTRTHLLVRAGAQRVRAELCAWRPALRAAERLSVVEVAR